MGTTTTKTTLARLLPSIWLCDERKREREREKASVEDGDGTKLPSFLTYLSDAARSACLLAFLAGRDIERER